MEYIENLTFDEIAVGDTHTLVRTLRYEDIQMFAVLSGDLNPTHVDPQYAKSSSFRDVVGHGMWGGILVSNVLGTEFPGPGTVYASQTFNFERPVRVGDTLTVTVTCRQKFAHNHHIVFDCKAVNQVGEAVLGGVAEVLAPQEKIRRPKVTMPELSLRETKAARFEHLMKITEGLPAIAMAVAHPCDAESLRGALLARDRNIIVPTLVGPEAKIRAVAEGSARPRGHGHPRRAAQPRGGGGVGGAGPRGQGRRADEGVAPHRRADGRGRIVRQGPADRAPHQPRLLMDVPTYPRLLLITDVAVNIVPDLVTKVDIVQNAIDLARMLGNPEPKVAILAAVETVTPKMQATVDAACLCKMADRGQITGGLLDGPLAFDNAVSIAAARTKGIRSVVAGRPTSSWCPTSRPATCSPSSWSTSRRPRPPASSWAPACPSSSPAARIPPRRAPRRRPWPR